MKHVVILLALAFSAINSRGQAFSFSLTGNPVNTTGWTTGAQSFVDADQFVLTNNLSNQAGYIYYSTPQNLTNCARFTVSFEFRITNSSIPTADGIAFWYISNPPTGFTSGGGIGLPNNPNGLLLILDTYDNNSTPNNPLVSLRLLDGTSNYAEGSTTGQLAPDLTSQGFITDGNWHTCVLSYNFGTVTVAFDGNPPAMTGTTTLSLNGYFGFSAGTGASWAKHAIRNVLITGAPEPQPPVTAPIVYCQFDNAVPLTATGTNLSWYTTLTGGSPLPGAPTPGTAVPGTYTWYVSQEVTGCNLESARAPLEVTINPTPGPPSILVPKYCSGQAASAITITSGTNVLWYDAPTGGTGVATIPVVNTDAAGTFTWYATQTNASGCESSRIAVTAVVEQSPEIDFSYEIGYACDADTVYFQNESVAATTFLWTFNDGLTDTAANPAHVYANQGTYLVTLVGNNAHCSDSATKPITISHPLIAAFTPSADTICVGSTVAFTNTSTANTINNTDPSYFWDFGDGSSSVAQHPSHQFNTPGVYNVMMVVQNFVPCTDTAYKLVYVDSVPSLSFNRSDTAICMGDHIDFTALYSANGLQHIAWNFGDSPDLTPDVNPGRHAFDAPGTYTVTLSGNYRVCDDISTTAQVTIKPLPVINLGPDTAICLDAASILLADNINASNPKAQWQWSTGAKTSAIEVKHHGLYKATVTIDQCSATDEVNVVKDCNIDIPNSFTPNNDGANDYFFPRQLLSKGVAGFRMVIFNRWGQKIFETTNLSGRGWDGRFNEKEQPTGVYIYSIQVVMKNQRTEEYTGNVTLLR
jgi:gliding motility-associated-like protein